MKKGFNEFSNNSLTFLGACLFLIFFLAVNLMGSPPAEAMVPLQETPPAQTPVPPATGIPRVGLPQGGGEITINLGTTAALDIYFFPPDNNAYVITPRPSPGIRITSIVSQMPSVVTIESPVRGIEVKGSRSHIATLWFKSISEGLEQIEFQISDPVTSQLYGNPLPFRINVERIVAGLELPSGANQVIAGETIFLSLYLEKVYQPVKEGKINLYFADRGGRVISFSPPRNDAVREPDRPDPVQNIGIVRFLDLKPVPDGGKIKLIDVAVELQAEPGILNPDIRVEKMETSDGEPLNTRLIKPFVAIYPAPTPTPTPKPSPTPVPATPTPSPSPSPTPTFSPAPPPSPAFTGGAMPGQVSTPFPAEPLTPVLTTPSPVKAPAQVPQEGFRSRYLSRITLAVILLLINIVLIRISK